MREAPSPRSRGPVGIAPLDLTWRSRHTSHAATILIYARQTAADLLDAFQTVRNAQGSRGTTTDTQQDILRAMLVFATAGLDASVKRLVQDALPILAASSRDAQSALDDFGVRRLKPGGDIDARFLVRLVSAADSRAELIDEFVTDLTRGSLQNVEQLMAVRSALGLRDRGIEQGILGLRESFRIRNQIIHEMDMDLAARNRNRTSRTRANMVRDSNRVLSVAASIVMAVDSAVMEALGG